MSEIVDPGDIERIVGATRHSILHQARAVSAEQTVYVLHSRACVDHGGDLRDCAYSLALDHGINITDWTDFEDKPVAVQISHGRLVPFARTDPPADPDWSRQCAYCAKAKIACQPQPCCDDCTSDPHSHCPSWPTCTRNDYGRSCEASPSVVPEVSTPCATTAAPCTQTLEAVLTRTLAHCHGLDGFAARELARERIAGFERAMTNHVPLLVNVSRGAAEVARVLAELSLMWATSAFVTSRSKRGGV